MNKPKYLYKYSSAEGAIQILRDNYLYLCPIEKLNDLYEGSVAAAVKFNAEDAKELEIRRMMALGALSREHAISFVEEHRNDAEIKENFDYFMNGLLDFNDVMRVHSGVVCFSSAFNHQKMWGTYGDNHSGVCIQFWEDNGSSVIHKHAVPVIYTNERRTRLLIDHFAPDGSLNPATIAKLFYTTKTTHWEDEDEWRILMIADREQSFEDRKFIFPSTNIRRVFLGPRVDEEQSKVINDMSKGDMEWSVFRVLSDHRKGITYFQGVEQIKSYQDIEFWADKFQRSE